MVPSPIPSKFRYLTEGPQPLAITAGLSQFGLHEGLGHANNPTILTWTKAINAVVLTQYSQWATDFYNADAIPWCGLFTAWCETRAAGANPARKAVGNYLSALAWAAYGQPIPFKSLTGKFDLKALLVGDIAVFVREGGGHVGQVVGVSSDGQSLFVLGGNQADQVSIAEFAATRLYAVRRPPYQTVPPGAKHVVLSPTGQLSQNEA